MVKNHNHARDIRSLDPGWEDPLEQGMSTTQLFLYKVMDSKGIAEAPWSAKCKELHTTDFTWHTVMPNSYI